MGQARTEGRRIVTATIGDYTPGSSGCVSVAGGNTYTWTHPAPVPPTVTLARNAVVSLRAMLADESVDDATRLRAAILVLDVVLGTP